MPLVCKDMVDILDVGVNSTSANHTSLSNFAFLYGVFPTAPSVAIYAGHYNMELEVVSTRDAAGLAGWNTSQLLLEDQVLGPPG